MGATRSAAETSSVSARHRKASPVLQGAQSWKMLLFSEAAVVVGAGDPPAEGEGEGAAYCLRRVAIGSGGQVLGGTMMTSSRKTDRSVSLGNQIFERVLPK